MNKSGLDKLFWGFFFILLNFRIQGFDILPDIVGYIFLAFGIRNLILNSAYFEQAAKYNVLMIMFSILSIYQAPAHGGGINLGILGVLGIPIMIASFIINLLLVYSIFMGIKDMSQKLGQYDLAEESDERWNQYRNLQIALVFAFVLMFIPPLALLYFIILFIASIIITISILGFLRRCSENLNSSL
jgi:hypothetical protein